MSLEYERSGGTQLALPRLNIGQRFTLWEGKTVTIGTVERLVDSSVGGGD
jgi:hypothetical protein